MPTVQIGNGGAEAHLPQAAQVDLSEVRLCPVPEGQKVIETGPSFQLYCN
jgi:hypothetical protein